MWGQSTERPGLGCGARKGEEENVTRLFFLLTAGTEGEVRWLLSSLVFSGNLFVSFFCVGREEK